VPPYKLRDFHIELTDFRHRIRGDPEQETDTEESPQLTDQYRARSHTQIREELLYNFDKETVAKEGQLNVQKKLLLNGTGDYVTRVEQSSSHHRSAIEDEEEDTKPVKISPASPCHGKVSSTRLPANWRSLEIHELATEVEACGVDPVIVEEHLVQNHGNVAKKIKCEIKSLVLPRDWRDKIRDELIEDLCSDNNLDKGLLDSELQLQQSQSDQVPSSPIKLKLPAEWRTMTKETLEENYGIMLERRTPDLVGDSYSDC